jgi:allophanate hydrolase subunit 1
MGEIKKHRSERWKVTTMGGGGGRNYATEMERKIGEKRNNHASVNMQNQFL